MPLFEIDQADELVPFRRLQAGADIYEREIESLVWGNPEEFLGYSLFLVARQPNLTIGGRPDIVGLDHEGRVVIIEIKRDVDRGQLAQCLEYAGWARTTNLDELARIYSTGNANAFFEDWQEFTASPAPVVVNRAPRLVLVARRFHDRTRAALDFLLDNQVPVTVLPVALYEDQQGRRFLDIEAEHEPEFASISDGADSHDYTKIDGRRVRLSDLLDAQLIVSGDALVWHRPRRGATYHASVTANGAVQLEDGRVYSSPSRAAVEVADSPAGFDGWWMWRVPRLDNVLLNDLRIELARRRALGR